MCPPVTLTEIYNSSSQKVVLRTNSKTFHNANSFKISINNLSYIITPLILLKIRKNTKFTTYKYQHMNRKCLQYKLYSPITAISILRAYKGSITPNCRQCLNHQHSACCYFHSHAVLSATIIRGGI